MAVVFDLFRDAIEAVYHAILAFGAALFGVVMSTARQPVILGGAGRSDPALAFTGQPISAALYERNRHEAHTTQRSAARAI